MLYKYEMKIHQEKMMNKITLFILITFFFALPAWATTYYVDNITGSNSNYGSAGNPWKELPGTVNPTGSTSGWTTIKAGDTILLTAGQEWNKGVLINSTYYNNGTSGSYITITSSSPPTRAIFDFNGGSTDTASNNAAFQVRRDYITFEYLEIREITASGGCSGFYIGNADANDYNKIQYCYIHDIIDTTVISGTPGSCTGENYSYGVIMVWATGTEIAYNIFKNIDKKFIGTSENYGGSHLIHHNVAYNESGFTGDPIDHGIVISSANGGNSVYNNIIWNNHKYYGKNYAINLASAGGNNKVYNNIIRGWNIGIATRTDGNNEIVNNTIYLAEQPATRHSCYYDENTSHAGIYIDRSNNNTIRNNIIYYPKEIFGKGRVVVWAGSGTDNTVTHNLFYGTGADIIAATGNITFRTLSYMENMWDGTNNNVWNNNTVENPGFSGGNHPVSNLPTGFNEIWIPNNNGLYITSGSSAKDTGFELISPYDIDIKNDLRPTGSGWDIGAYEYYEHDYLSPSEPTNLQILNNQ